MKEKILYLIIGLLVGAIITAGGFLIFGKSSTSGTPENFDRSQMRGTMEEGEFDSNMTPPDGAKGERGTQSTTTENTTTTENSI